MNVKLVGKNQRGIVTARIVKRPLWMWAERSLCMYSCLCGGRVSGTESDILLLLERQRDCGRKGQHLPKTIKISYDRCGEL